MSGETSDILWAREFLVRNNKILKGAPVVFSDQPWAKVFCLECHDTRYFLKIPNSAFKIEAELQIFLDTLMAPVVNVLAYRKTGAFLMPDCGEPFRVIYPKNRNLTALMELIPAYAELQISTSNKIQELSALPNWSIENFPDAFANMLDSLSRDSTGFSGEELNSLLKTQDYLTIVCQRLDAIGLPPTIDHGDFGDGNIFVKDGKALVADWGESVIGHPFFSVIHLMETIKRRHGPIANQELPRLKEIYLPRWLGFADKDKLDQAMSLAELLYPVRYMLGFNRFWNACGADTMASKAGWSRFALKKWLYNAQAH